MVWKEHSFGILALPVSFVYGYFQEQMDEINTKFLP